MTKANESTLPVDELLYLKGYKQAEKDFALTKNDVRTIFNLVQELQNKYSSIDGCFQAVADIFNGKRNNG